MWRSWPAPLLVILVRVAAAQTPAEYPAKNETVTAERCDFPAGLGDEISNKYPGTRIVRLADLEEQDRKLFVEDHGTRCPGLVRVDFYGDRKPTWALVLIGAKDSPRKAELVVAHKAANSWATRSLETTDETPVVWREGPGKDDDISEPKTIRATRPVIVFCGYGSWAIPYAWTGKAVEKIWISD